MRLQGAFQIPGHPKQGLLRIHPSSKRLAPYMTGGLQLLYSNIDKRIVPESHGLGAYTDEKGRFRPQKGMPLLAKRYRFVDVIGKGQSSISVKAADTYCDDRLVAVKVLHQHNYTLGFQESDCVRRLNTADPFCLSPTFRMHTTFCFDGHYCMVFELLRPEPLHSYFKHVEDPEKLDKIRHVTVQLLKALGFLQQQNVLHADLKPENILLSKEDDLNSLKVVDFGNAIHCVHAELSLYYDDFELQTLLYRAPEVMFGQPFGLEADMWSLGCILAELYHGQSLFFAKDKAGVLQKIVEVLGPLPETVFQRGKFFSQFRHFTTRSLSPKNSTNTMMNLLRCTNYPFCNFLVRLLTYNPAERLTVAEAACHPFLAPLAGVAYFLPRGSFRGYPQVFLDQKDFAGQPTVAPEIERMSLDPISLLKRGTHTTTPPATRQIAQVTPMQHSNTSKSSQSSRGYNSSRNTGQERAFAFEQNNNQVLVNQHQPQPRPAHSNAAVTGINRDVEPIDLTQSSPQPIHTNRPSVGISPNAYLHTVDRAQSSDQGISNSRRPPTNRKRPRNQTASGRQVGRTSSQKMGQNGPVIHSSQGIDTSVPQQMNKPVTDMFKSWEDSMSKYIDKSQDQPKWSERAGQVVSTAIGKGLGVVSYTSSGRRGGQESNKFHGASNSSELRSFALQPNRVAKVKTSKNAKPVDSKLRQGSTDGTNSVARQRKKRSTPIPKSESAHSNTISKKNPPKRTFSSGSDEIKWAQLARETYQPQYSDISNSQSIDENVSPRGISDGKIETNFTSYLQAHHDRDFKRSVSDINANSLHFSNQVYLSGTGYDSTSEESDTSESGEDSSFVPPKKRKRYRKTSSDSLDMTSADKSNSSSRSGLSVIVNGFAERDARDSKKTELRKVLLSEKAAIEKNMSKISQKKGANEDGVDLRSAQVDRFHNPRQGRIDASVYDFESEMSQSPKINRKVPTLKRKMNQNGVAKFFANKTPTKSKSRVPNHPGSGGSQRKRPTVRIKTIERNAAHRTSSQRSTEAELPRRTSPRKHASTARLSGSVEGQLYQNGLNEDTNGMSDTSVDESDVLQMTVYSGSRNSSPLSNEDEVVLMSM